MSAEPLPFLTPEEYLARERAAETRSEYYAGQIYSEIYYEVELPPASDADAMPSRP